MISGLRPTVPRTECARKSLFMQIQLAQLADFAAILELQARYHLSALPENALEQGFVTTQLDFETLAKMHAQRALWVAKTDDTGDVAAYACAVEWDFYQNSRFVETVCERFPLPFDTRLVTADNSFLYGPACIDERFRGQNVLPQLVGAIKARYAATREFGVCFVDVRNARSLAAHERKLGFTRVAMLPFADVTYTMLAFSTR